MASRQFDTTRLLGFACYDCMAGVCEIVVLVTLVERSGVGSALVDALAAKAKGRGCGRLRVFTSNDNVEALGFYEKRGFRIKAVHENAMAEVRRYKPRLPTVGANGVPLRDMIELEMALTDAEAAP